MLDGAMRRIIDPATARIGAALARRGVQADALTLAGLAAGLACGLCVWLALDLAALLLLALNRTLDGLDGAVARERGLTDRGGYLDIVCDFIVYGAVPLAFALRDPAGNALASAVLLAAFYANGASFLAYAAIAAKRGLSTGRRGPKSLYYTTGLMEGTETILFFAAFLLLPGWYAPLALAFAALCAVTCVARMLLAWRVFGVDDAARSG
jgi:phosphatidylglycerophosphate synthase